MAELRNRYGDRHPRMINKQSELRDIEAKIGEEVRKIIQSLQSEVQVANAKVGSLSAEVNRLKAGAGREDQATVLLTQLEREKDASKTLYESFLGRFKQVSEQQDFQQADARIIARAEPPARPHFPDPFLFLVVSVVVGAAAGLILAYLIEYFDRGFRGAIQIEKATGYPAIGLIPSLKGTSDKLPEDYVLEKPLSSYTEALRSVRTAIHFSNVDAPAKVVMFTSALPAEGKTTLCMSLARTLAMAGNKVLLIEGDLRRPRLKKALKAPASVGDIAQLLAGDKKLEECLVADKASGMHFIVSHGGTPSPQDLLGSQQMERFVSAMRQKYDLIIIDTPPILAVSDAALIGKMVDTAVFVIRWADTPREVAVGAIKTLLGYKLRLAGIVLSQVDLEAHARYGYGDQGYYYGRYREYYAN
jgi:capsular exopolysaccharide synthesis family protein